MSDPKTLRDRANAAEFVNRPGEAEALRKAADRIAELEVDVERLRRWRVEQDCCYTMGAVADMSGSHCPSGRPCVRCEHEREVERLTRVRDAARAVFNAANSATQEAAMQRLRAALEVKDE
jgi:hypothetical protein